MARDTIDMTPLETRDELVAWFEKGVKSREVFRIGTEHEKFPFYTETLKPVPYKGGIEEILRGMEKLLGWEPIMEGSTIIGLADVVGGGAISLEPGGQFELSGAPLETLHQTCLETKAHFAQVREVASKLGIGFLALGMSPKWTLAETPIMPKSRYKIMTNYMPKVGSRGLDMMYRTSTVQVNLDFSSEAEMVKMLRVSLALQPVGTAIFANSPFTEGKPNGNLSERSTIWKDTDNNRAGILPFAFEQGMGFERYVDFALDVPMYFVKRGDVYHDVTGGSFRDLMAGKLAQLPGERAVLSDWVNHVGTIFPEVRLKRYLEMRGADSGPLSHIVAMPALFTGLLYDTGVLDEAYEMVKNWSLEQRQALRNDVPHFGFQAKIGKQSVHSLAKEMLALAEKGLSRRKRHDAKGRDETVYLDPLRMYIEAGRTPAEEMLARFNGVWGGDINPVFIEKAY